MEKKNRMCEAILEAAKERFSHYGFGKTTMSEIAQDCKMSPGNLYRYFDGKLDIAEAIATFHWEKQLDHIRSIVRDPSQSATDRLKNFLLFVLREGYQILDEEPKMQEVADIISRERPKFAEQIMAKEKALISEILSAGNASGEFDIQDVLQVATVIQAATYKYRLPQLHSSLSLDKLEQEMGCLLELILGGLNCRKAHAAQAS